MALSGTLAVTGQTTLSGNLVVGSNRLIVAGSVTAAAATSLTLGAGGAEKMRIDVNGNVGIGNSVAVHALSVNGAAYVSGDVTCTNATLTGNIQMGSQKQLRLYSTTTYIDSINDNALRLYASGATSGVISLIPKGIAALSVASDGTNADTAITGNLTNSNGNVTASAAVGRGFFGNGYNLGQLVAGNVTSGQLDNARMPTNVNIGGTFRANGAVTILGGTSTAPAGISFANTDPGVMLEKRYAANDRYGVGQYTGGVTRVYAAGGYAAATLKLCFATGENTFTDALTCVPTGNVGIGTSSPAYQLQLSTDSAAKPTTSTWTISSDRRVKLNIEDADLDICYDTVKTLPLRRFTYDANVFPSVPDRNVVGWVAQEVANVLPKAVSITNQHGFPDFLGLDVDQIYKTMYGALRKVIDRNEALEARVALLEVMRQP